MNKKEIIDFLKSNLTINAKLSSFMKHDETHLGIYIELTLGEETICSTKHDVSTYFMAKR
jgi:hypothetical protein